MDVDASMADASMPDAVLRSRPVGYLVGGRWSVGCSLDGQVDGLLARCPIVGVLGRWAVGLSARQRV